MSRRHLNLAARPFVNSRPVARVTVLLAVLAAGFLIADAALFWGYYRGRTDQREHLEKLEADIATERQEVAEVARRLGSVDLGQQNRRALYLNNKIAERTFAWGRLFDHLTAILPGDVRLLSLKPEPLAGPASRRRGAGNGAAANRGTADVPEPAEERVSLEIQGAARRDEAILELLDALFADPAFDSPNLARESQQQSEVRFSLSAVYRPRVVADATDGTPTRDGAVGGEDPAAGAEDPAAGAETPAAGTESVPAPSAGAPAGKPGGQRS